MSISSLLWIHIHWNLPNIKKENKIKQNHKIRSDYVCTCCFIHSGIGGPVFINENGDRDTDFTLLDMDPVSGDFRVRLTYSCVKYTCLI